MKTFGHIEGSNMINRSSNNLLSRSGNSMKGVNFDITYAQRKMSNFEQKTEEQKIAEEVRLQFYLKSLIRTLDQIITSCLQVNQNLKANITNSISKLLETYKKTKFAQNFDMALLEYGKNGSKNSKAKGKQNTRSKNFSMVEQKKDDEKDPSKDGTTKKRSYSRDSKTARLKNRNSAFSLNCSPKQYIPPVGKYTPIYNQIIASPSRNSKFKPLSTRNSERYPYNSFVKTYHIEGKFNQYNLNACNRCTSNPHSNQNHKSKHLVNMISKMKKNKKFNNRRFFQTPQCSSRDK